MTGFEVLRKLRISKVKTPVLILSGLAGIEDKIKGLGFGADDYMTKPFHWDELVARIYAIVRRYRGHAQSVITTDARRIGNTLPRAQRQPWRKKRGPEILEGRGAEGLLWAGRSSVRPHLDYARPIGRASGGRAFGRPRAITFMSARSCIRTPLPISDAAQTRDINGIGHGRPSLLAVGGKWRSGAEITRSLRNNDVLPRESAPRDVLFLITTMRCRLCRRSQKQESGTSWSTVWLATVPSH
jgi:CheY-like chemotaxis protein